MIITEQKLKEIYQEEYCNMILEAYAENDIAALNRLAEQDSTGLIREAFDSRSGEELDKYTVKKYIKDMQLNDEQINDLNMLADLFKRFGNKYKEIANQIDLYPEILYNDLRQELVDILIKKDDKLRGSIPADTPSEDPKSTFLTKFNKAINPIFSKKSMRRQATLEEYQKHVLKYIFPVIQKKQNINIVKFINNGEFDKQVDRLKKQTENISSRRGIYTTQILANLAKNDEEFLKEEGLKPGSDDLSVVERARNSLKGPEDFELWSRKPGNREFVTDLFKTYDSLYDLIYFQKNQFSVPDADIEEKNKIQEEFEKDKENLYNKLVQFYNTGGADFVLEDLKKEFPKEIVDKIVNHFRSDEEEPKDTSEPEDASASTSGGEEAATSEIPEEEPYERPEVDQKSFNRAVQTARMTVDHVNNQDLNNFFSSIFATRRDIYINLLPATFEQNIIETARSIIQSNKDLVENGELSPVEFRKILFSTRTVLSLVKNYLLPRTNLDDNQVRDFSKEIEELQTDFTFISQEMNTGKSEKPAGSEAREGRPAGPSETGTSKLRTMTDWRGREIPLVKRDPTPRFPSFGSMTPENVVTAARRDLLKKKFEGSPLSEEDDFESWLEMHEDEGFVKLKQIINASKSPSTRADASAARPVTSPPAASAALPTGPVTSPPVASTPAAPAKQEVTPGIEKILSKYTINKLFLKDEKYMDQEVPITLPLLNDMYEKDYIVIKDDKAYLKNSPEKEIGNLLIRDISSYEKYFPGAKLKSATTSEPAQTNAGVPADTKKDTGAAQQEVEQPNFQQISDRDAANIDGIERAILKFQQSLTPPNLKHLLEPSTANIKDFGGYFDIALNGKTIRVPKRSDFDKNMVKSEFVTDNFEVPGDSEEYKIIRYPRITNGNVTEKGILSPKQPNVSESLFNKKLTKILAESKNLSKQVETEYRNIEKNNIKNNLKDIEKTINSLLKEQKEFSGDLKKEIIKERKEFNESVSRLKTLAGLK